MPSILKKILVMICLPAAIFAAAQQESAKTENAMYLKGNALFLPLGMLNSALEIQLGPRTTIQPEIFISPWKSFLGKYAQIYTAGVDGRYYFNEAFRHFYLGANFSFSRYKMQKYNYWSDDEAQYNLDSPFYRKSDLYQNGFTFFLGAVVGYQWELSEKLNMDLFLGGGTAQSFYKGFHKTLGVRYDTDPTREYNRSGEWIPYRGGLMISYKIR